MCFLLFAAGISAQTGAQANYKITSAGTNATGTMKMYFSAQNSRVEFNLLIPQMPGGGISKTSIVKSDKPTTVYALDDKNKTYSTAEVQPNNNTSGDNITVKVIGKEKIGNYNCTHAQVTKGTETSDYWTTTEIADYSSYKKTNANPKFMGGAAEQAALVKNNADGFLVKAVTKDPRGSLMTRS